MIKRIKDMTDIDKGIFFEKTKKALFELNGIPWMEMEAKIIADMDAAFDDDLYENLKRENPEMAKDAKRAREYFKWDKEHKRPAFVDYMLWMAQAVTASEWVEV